MSEEKNNAVCVLTGKKADFYIGVAKANKYVPEKIIGAVVENKVSEAIHTIMGQAFGTIYRVVVLDLKKNLIYHSFDADQEKLSARLGWELKLMELSQKDKL